MAGSICATEEKYTYFNTKINYISYKPTELYTLDSGLY